MNAYSLSSETPHLPRHSPKLLAMFGKYARSYMARRFNAVRLLKNEYENLDIPHNDDPVILYLNHPSWWDPLTSILLATQRFPQRSHYAPMDAAMLRKYSFFERLGFFGIDPESSTGAARLIRASRAILQKPGSMLWITAEGKFTDCRPRPLNLRPGLAHIARYRTNAWIVPMALEYTFWHESTPEALIALGEPMRVSADTSQLTVEEWQNKLSFTLEALMDELADASCTRKEELFINLLQGTRGVGGVYDLWRRFKSMARGSRFDPAHMDQSQNSQALQTGNTRAAQQSSQGFPS